MQITPFWKASSDFVHVHNLLLNGPGIFVSCHLLYYIPTRLTIHQVDRLRGLVTLPSIILHYNLPRKILRHVCHGSFNCRSRLLFPLSGGAHSETIRTASHRYCRSSNSKDISISLLRTMALIDPISQTFMGQYLEMCDAGLFPGGSSRSWMYIGLASKLAQGVSHGQFHTYI